VPPDKDIHEWTLATLHSFKDDPANGASPVGNLIFGEDGALYGATEYGGTPNSGTFGGPCGFFYSCGTIYRLSGADVNWNLTYLYAF
jgi:hypothetical protein